MVELSLRQSVDAQWHGIAEVASHIRIFFHADRTTARGRDRLIAHTSQHIEGIDRIIEGRLQLIGRLDRIEAGMARPAPDIAANAPLNAADRAALRQVLEDMEPIALSYRDQLMAIMYQLNPEDAWAWEPENLTRIRRVKAGLTAQGGTIYEGEDALESAFAQVDAELERRAHV